MQSKHYISNSKEMVNLERFYLQWAGDNELLRLQRHHFKITAWIY